MANDRNSNGKVIVTCALTGAQQGKQANPNLPEQPDEIIAQGLEAWRAGAAILHLHARDAKGKASCDVGIFRKIVDGLRGAGCDAVLNLSTGGAVAGLSLKERMRLVPGIKPEIASFSVGGGSLLGRYEEQQGGWIGDRWVPLFSSHEEMERAAVLFAENNTKPELEVYHAAMINNIRDLRDRGVLSEPMLINFVMGIRGEVSEATVKNLLHLVESIPGRFEWLISAIGASNHYRMLGAVFAMGGHVRVGMEDNIYIGRGELAASNGQIVEKAMRILAELGADCASPDEAREILDLRAT